MTIKNKLNFWHRVLFVLETLFLNKTLLAAVAAVVSLMAAVLWFRSALGVLEWVLLVLGGLVLFVLVVMPFVLLVFWHLAGKLDNQNDIEVTEGTLRVVYPAKPAVDIGFDNVELRTVGSRFLVLSDKSAPAFTLLVKIGKDNRPAVEDLLARLVIFGGGSGPTEAAVRDPEAKA